MFSLLIGRADLSLVFFFLFFVHWFITSVIYKIIKKKNKAYSYNDSREISTIDGYDEYLKKEFMLPFLKIFFNNPEWKKISQEEVEHFDKFITDKKLICSFPRNMNVTTTTYGKQDYKFTRKYYDDYIKTEYKDVNIEMTELSTYPYRIENIFIEFNVFILWSLMVVIFGMYCPIMTKYHPDLHIPPFWIYFPAACFLISPLIYLILFLIKKISSFRGVIVTLTMNKKFKGTTTIIQKNSADKVNFDTSRYKQVNLESSDFSKHFDVYSDDQIEARYILTTSMMERIFNIKDAYNAKNIRLHFEEGKVYIVINTGRDMFAMGISEQKSRFNDFNKLALEMKSLIRLIKELKLNQKIGL